MRSTLLAGAAVCAVCLALPSVPQVGASKGSAPFDPLAYLSTICKSRSGEPPLLGRFLQAAAAYAATAPTAPPRRRR